jgi:hypothetical protein
MNPFENTQAALKLLPKYLQNHLNKIENGTPESGITVAQRDLINGAIGRMNADQVKANPVLEGLGDRRSQRQQSFRSRRLDRIGNAVRGEPGYPAVKSAIEQNKLPMRIPAFHGTPHTLAPEAGAPLGKFRTSKIGTGEGAQAYGHGLYFAGKREVAEHYRNYLTRNRSRSASDDMQYILVDGEPVLNKYDIDVIWSEDASKVRDKKSAIKHFNERRNSWSRLTKDPDYQFQNYAQDKLSAYNKLLKDFKAGSNYSYGKEGSLYKVELAPKDSEYLLWDKPLSEQPKGVREKIEPIIKKFGVNTTFRGKGDSGATHPKFWKDIEAKGDVIYGELAGKLGSKPKSSAALKEAGIPGIKYLDGASRSKGEGDYNYVIFDEADVTVTEKLFMPAAEAGAGKGKQAEAAKRLKDLELSAKKDPLDSRDRNHLAQASLLEGIINESQGGAELDIRIGKHESGEGSRYIEYISEDGDSFKIRATDHDRQLSSITNHSSPDFTLASNKRNVSESSGDWIDAIVKLENETDFRVPARLEDRINSIINRRKEIQGLRQEITKQERLAQEQARKVKEDAQANALETPKGKILSDEINSIRLELQNSSGTGKYTKNQRKSMFKKVRRLEDELEKMGTFDAGERNINYMPSDPKAPKAQPANRIKQQAPAMPSNRFMAPAASAGAKLSERFR